MPDLTSLRRTLQEMHMYCRPHDGITLKGFCARFIRPLAGAFKDTFGNWHVKVDQAPVLWSCHTDTVHRRDGYQHPEIDSADVLRLPKDSKSNCLGADDTAGVWLLREMILAGRPGYYLFHHAEEAGSIGSRDLAAKHSRWLTDHFTSAIALDRRGTSDVITHQCSERTASESFAGALATALGGGYRPDDSGMFTDTHSYRRAIPECTNLSIGYSGAHGSGETLDVAHVLRLRERLLTLDTSTLPIARDPSVVEKLKSKWTETDWRQRWQHAESGSTYLSRIPVTAPRCPDCTHKSAEAVYVRMVDEGSWHWCPICGATYSEAELRNETEREHKRTIGEKLSRLFLG